MSYQIVDSRMVLVSELPKCQWKTELEKLVQDPSIATVTVVLVNQHGKNVGMIGYPSDFTLKPEVKSDPMVLYHVEKIQTPEQVAKLGNQLDDNTAKQLFSRLFR